MPENYEEDNESITSIEFNDYSKNDKETYITTTFSALGAGYCTNAVNKSRYPFRVNSKESLQLFIVMNSMSKNNREDPIKLFYDSPEQYERHTRRKVSKVIKDKFATRKLQFIEANT